MQKNLMWLFGVLCFCGLALIDCVPPTVSKEKEKEVAKEAITSDAAETPEEVIFFEQTLESIPPEGPFFTDTMAATFSTPKAGHRGDVTNLAGEAKAQGPPITSLKWSLYHVDREAYFDGKTFGSDVPVWTPWPGTASFSMDLRAFRFLWGQAYTIYVELSNGKDEYSRSFQTWVQGLSWQIRSWDGGWRIGGGDLDVGDLYLAGYEGLLMRSEETASWFSPLALPGARKIWSARNPVGVSIAIGDRGKLWRSEDQATTWTLLTLEKETGGLDLTSLAASRDEKTLLVGGDGGLVLRSTDGGKTWTKSAEQGQGRCKALCTLGAGIWVRLEEAQGTASLFLSEDDGKGWTKLTLPSEPAVIASLGCSPKDERIVIGGGTGKIVRSLDRGKTWENATTDLAPPSTLTIRGLGGDPQDGRLYAVGDQGLLLLSEDKGATWKTKRAATEGEATLHDLRFSADGTKGLLVGEGDTLLITTDSGARWTRTTPPRNAQKGPFYTASFPTGPVVGWVGGKDGIALTEDAGKTWQEVLRGEVIHSIAWPQDGIGLAVGTKICRTEDIGKTWSCQALPIDGPLYRVAFLNPNLGFAVGAKGALLQSTDGGRSWKTLLVPTGEDLRGLSVFSDTLFVLCGTKGLIMKTKDGARTWQTQDSQTQKNLNDLLFPLDELTGYAIGEGGTILKTEDGGTWKAQVSGTSQTLHALSFPSNLLEGYAIGEGGTRLKTLDGGVAWRVLPEYHRVDFFGMAWPGGSRIGYMVGSEKMVIFSLDGFD